MSVYVRHDSTFVYRNSVIGEKSGIVPNMGKGRAHHGQWCFFNNPMSILMASSIWYATFLALLCVNFSSLCLKEI